MRRRHQPSAPRDLTEKIAAALARVETGKARLARATAAGAPLPVRRSAHAELRTAYGSADTLLRQAVRYAEQHSYPEWSRWRTRLSRLDAARQAQLFAEVDAVGVHLGLGTTRAIDTGMSGPAIGDLLHGESCPPGAPARYGLDLEALLSGSAEHELPATQTDEGRLAERRPHPTVVPTPVDAAGSPLEAA